MNIPLRYQIAFGLIAAFGGAVTVLKYFDDKKSDKLKNEVLALDKEIKTLELDIKKGQSRLVA